MAFQSLYRKHRPQTFGELVGQEAVSTALRNAVREGRVGHAYLFSGPRGTGKTTTARLLAKALNCTGPRDDLPAGEPCNGCPSCTEITGGVSVDVVELDAASNRGVGEMRALLERVAYRSAGG
ncbi:MAG TPA: AAA family ATPase, partial [Acidimicrobiia bacterium]|nr:AAA family ATPase [Acidimicrobiia bacterium]